jgi:predicted negative regulator of RcsB-dependent stress response
MTEELNLSELFANFVKFISRNIKLLSIIVFIGVIGVIGYQKFKKPYYETKAICMSGIAEYERQEQIEDLSQRTAIDLINHLQINIENEEYGALATLLGVDEKVSATIKKIEAEQLYQQDMDEKFYALNKFEISLTTFDNMLIDQLQKGLIYYFSNNDFIKDYHANYLASNIVIISDINAEIEVLGDMRVEGAKNNLDVSSVNIVSGKNGRVISNQIVALSQLREDIKTKQALLKPLVFVQNFAKVNEKEDDILIWTVLGGFISFLIGMFIARVKEVKG